MLESLQFDTGQNPTWAMIWLHGLGASGHDLAPLMAELVRPHWPAVRCIFPHAPERAVTLNGGARMRAWYDIVSSQLTQDVDQNGIFAAMAQVRTLIQALTQQGLPPARIFLGGFSQGGVIALHAGLRHSNPLAGIIALSTYLPDLADDSPPSDRHWSTQRIFLAHGVNDPIVPLWLGQRAADWLRLQRCRLQWETFAMGHHICPEEVIAVQNWLEQCLHTSA